MMSLRFVILLSTLFLTSCGWRSAQNFDSRTARTIAIPYIQGDIDGSVTTELIEQIQQEGGFRYDPCGELTLKARLVDEDYLNIGFRYVHSEGSRHTKHKIIPNESRTKLLAEVSVIDNATQKVLLGPSNILATCDYDHQNYSLNTDINIFSLGQLSDIDTTKDVLSIPLNRNLAREITFYLQNNYDVFCQQNTTLKQ